MAKKFRNAPLYARGRVTLGGNAGGAIAKVGVSIPANFKFGGLGRRDLAEDDKIQPMRQGQKPDTRATRLKAIKDRAVEFFEGNKKSAESWLRAPALYLDNKRPVDMAGSKAGTEKVLILLERLEHGVYT